MNVLIFMEHHLFSSVLDEATSALDTSTESKLYSICKDFGITVSSIGHRRSLRQVCIIHANESANERSNRCANGQTSSPTNAKTNTRTHFWTKECTKNRTEEGTTERTKKQNDSAQMHWLITSPIGLFSSVSRLWVEPWRRRRMGTQENWRWLKFSEEVEEKIECLQ